MTEIDEDWEEWDGVSPFWHHCVAGSVAGLAEHTLVYPLDTVRTHIQVCANCKFSPAFQQKQQMASTGNSSGNASLNMVKSSANKVAQHSSSHSNLHNHHHHNHHLHHTKLGVSRLASPVSATTGATSQPQLPQGMWQTMRYLMSEPAVLEPQQPLKTAATTAVEPPAGILRLWRGVQTMMIGCIPAHAVYFSSYEAVKAYMSSDNGELIWYGGMMAGATATLGHDMIMAPLDTVKQRLQIGHYQGSMSTALKQMVQQEGAIALYRSFPITLFANLPYGMIMVSTNESLKQIWTQPKFAGEAPQPLTLSTTLLASSMAGFVAAAVTTPLDRIKTLLQTQQMAPACWPTPPVHCPQAAAVASQTKEATAIRNAHQALRHILKQEGTIGLFRGLVPRVMSHTPAVAISWTTYETAKSLLWKVTNQ